jgi:hypothetical protein
MQNQRPPVFVNFLILFVVLFVVVITSPAVGVATDPAYNISVEGSYETPTDSVTVEGEQFTVSAVGVASEHEGITVSVDAPANAEYQINLYTLDQQIQDFRTATGPETVTFDTNLVDPGSYVVAAVDNDDFFAVHPVVVTDYNQTTVVPDRVPTNTAVSGAVTVEAKPGENPIGSVELAVWNKTWRNRSVLKSRGNRRYTGSLPGLSNGTYRVSAVVVASERIDGEKNVLAVSKPATIVADPTITAPINDSDDISPPQTDPNSTGNGSADPVQDDGIISPSGGTESADDSGDGFAWYTAFISVILLGVFSLWQLYSITGRRQY